MPVVESGNRSFCCIEDKELLIWSWFFSAVAEAFQFLCGNSGMVFLPMLHSAFRPAELGPFAENGK
jgi:hypothetical protein